MTLCDSVRLKSGNKVPVLVLVNRRFEEEKAAKKKARPLHGLLFKQSSTVHAVTVSRKIWNHSHTWESAQKGPLKSSVIKQAF